MADKTSNGKAPKLVVLQLTGANDYLNTVVPYTNPLYYDNRPNMHIPAEQVQPIDDTLGFNPNMQAVKRLYDEGKVAIIHSIGYPNPNYSHFRSMDIWYTCEPEKVSSEGWLGKVVRDLDPKGDNVLTAVNFGRGMPRVLSLSGVPVASVAQLDTYGVLSTLSGATRPMVQKTVPRMVGMAHDRTHPPAGPFREPGTHQAAHQPGRQHPGMDRPARRGAQRVDRAGGPAGAADHCSPRWLTRRARIAAARGVSGPAARISSSCNRRRAASVSRWNCGPGR